MRTGDFSPVKNFGLDLVLVREFLFPDYVVGTSLLVTEKERNPHVVGPPI